jgi:23S rRNA (cytosine1962-C5)-methyltransferase
LSSFLSSIIPIEEQVYPKVFLNKKKLAAVKRFHPWVFSGAIYKMEKPLEDGDLCEVCTPNGETLGVGYYQNSTIAVRILAFKKRKIDDVFWKEIIESAYNLRSKLNLTENEKTNAYRLIHAEGDRVPGLVIDIYGTTAVIQCHSIGIHQRIDDIKKALLSVFGNKLVAVYDKSNETLPKKYANLVENQYLFGESIEPTIKEHSYFFYVNWEEGQKTGFFLDQRENRNLLTRYVQGKSVLNTFCYSGGFSVYALKAKASLVHSVDISKKAIEWTNKNVELNQEQGEHKAFAMDVLKFLKQSEQMYDVVIVDPPAYAKSQKARHNAVQGYKRLNKEAMKRVKNGGLMFTFSCSQVVGQQLFENTILAAAIEHGRKVRIIHRLTQPADHPVNIFHPEGNYLKGLVIQIE